MNEARPEPAVTDASTSEWDMEYRSRRLRLIGIVAAAVVVVIHVTFGLLLTISNTGPDNIGWSDQAALICIGLVEACAIMLLARPRLRVGSRGVSVRNLATERLFEWDQVRGLTYPDKGFGGQLELPADEHVPVLAIQAGDGARAIEAMERYREIEQLYRGG
ncbi:PH domain-containing protein [Gordonia sp. i37]|uniref:PH domain-containing protein n=1 Tax=Gordonia sp. i37 TaxID=1961707 RepID=UPI0009ACDA0D|nr:PH domain-containing protein [Gordonia sp. i37]OPX15471.1 hypothetical protein B1964_09750 [Gordonia sp. i37]